MHILLVVVLLAIFIALGGGPVLFVFFAWLFKGGFPWVGFLLGLPFLILFTYIRYTNLTEPKDPKP